MKNLLIILIFCIIYVMSTSCEKMFGDFLEKAPGVDVTEDTIFSSQTQLETFVASIYERGMTSDYGYYISQNDNTAFHWANSCDEGDQPTGWFVSNGCWNSGGFSVTWATAEDNRFYNRWQTIRDIYILLDKIGTVPGLDAAYASQIKAEMKFLVGMLYFEMFKRLGGVPIITRYYKVSDEIKVPRSSLDSTVQFIVKNLDEAVAGLPDTWPSNWKGRATKGAALAQKAKALLFAASPLFNTGTPYLNMTDPGDNRLVCYTNYDVNRWKAAADAAKAVLDWAPAGGVQLVTDKGFDKNYKFVWEVMDNSEIIIADKILNGNSDGKTATGGTIGNGAPWLAINPMPFGGWGGVNCLQQFVEKFYENRYTGKPIVWYASGTDLNQKYDSMDYRFMQTIGYNGSRWQNNINPLETWKAIPPSTANGAHSNSCNSGYWMHKFLPENRTNTTPVNWPTFRLAEFYLSYAEALNEFSASPPPEAYTAVNTIRARSGMPNLPAGLTQAQFRDRVRKEWGVEFAYENHRFWDIKRWLIAEEAGVMQGSMMKINITKGAVVGGIQQFSYQRQILENRVWWRYAYLNPWAVSEVNKGFIKQNPGY